MSKGMSKPKLIKNAISYQNKTAPNSLTVHEWNHIINALKTQANLNTEYLETLHYVLFGSSTADFWWNGTTIKALSPQKLDLTEYVKSKDLATVALTGSYNDLTNKPIIPTIPNISITNGTAETGKYISQVAVDATDKHKLVITKADLPQGFSGNYNDLTNKPTLFSGNYEDLTNKPTIPTVPIISTNIAADETSNTKTASPKAVKDYVDNAISTALGALLGGSY